MLDARGQVGTISKVAIPGRSRGEEVGTGGSLSPLDVIFYADQDSGKDAEITDYIKRSGISTGRETTTALYALQQQMSAYRPLSVEDQRIRLARYNEGLIAAARLAVNRNHSPKLEHELRTAVRVGETAQMELIGSMFRLVMIIARELATNRYGRERALPLLEELVADANLELVEALPRFDPTRVPSFSVYAGRVIRDRIRSSLSNSSHIQVPSAWIRTNAIAATRVPELAAELGRAPSLDEIKTALTERCMAWAADHLTPEQKELDEPERLVLMRAKLVKQGMLGAIERYEEVVQLTRMAVSLDAPVGEEGGGTYGDFLDLEGSLSRDSTFDEVELRQLSSDIADALSSLPERERGIILRRFGYVDGENWTYARLAPEYGISAERVRQIEANVLAKLRGPNFAHLAGYLGAGQEEDDAPPPRRSTGNFG